MVNEMAMQQTEIGLIPEDWEANDLNYLTTLIIDGTHFTPTYTERGVPFLRVTDVQSNNIRFDKIKYISNEEHSLLSRRCKPENGDLLLSKNGTIGIPKVVNWDWEFSIFVSLALIKIKKSKLNIGYLAQLFKSSLIEKQISEQSKQGTVTNLHLEEIRKFQIPLPPLPEQEAIAEALSDCDAWIDGIEQLLAKKHLIKQGAMQELLTPKEDWEVKKLGEIAEVRDGTHQTPTYVESGIPFYSVESVTKNDFKNTKFISLKEHKILTKTFRIEKGDVLMTRIGSIGDCKLVDWDVDASFYVSLALIKIKAGCSASYFTHYSKTESFKKEAEINSLQSAIPKKINLGPISNIKISFPSLFEQTRIASILSDMDAELEVLGQKLAKARQIKQGMMQELLTGRVRLIVNG